jgi:hypothetical protein
MERQQFCALDLEPLGDGRVRVLQPSAFEGPIAIELHPLQVLALARVAGLSVAGRQTGRMLARLARGLERIDEMCVDLRDALTHSRASEHTNLDAVFALLENMGERVLDLLGDLDEGGAPAAEIQPDSTVEAKAEQ